MKRLGYLPSLWHYSISSGCPCVTHLAFAYDLLILASGYKRAVRSPMQLLQQYEEVSGQAISSTKSVITIDPAFQMDRRCALYRAFGFSISHPPFQYLGCSLMNGHRNVAMFNLLVKRIRERILDSIIVYYCMEVS